MNNMKKIHWMIGANLFVSLLFIAYLIFFLFFVDPWVSKHALGAIRISLVGIKSLAIIITVGSVVLITGNAELRAQKRLYVFCVVLVCVQILLQGAAYVMDQAVAEAVQKWTILQLGQYRTNEVVR